MLRNHLDWLCCALLAGCSAVPPTSTTPSGAAGSRAGEAAATPPDTLAVSGLRGTLTQQEIQGALDPKLPKLLRCVEQRRSEVEALAGEITLSFHIATSGAVAAVTPSASTLGDREAERCMLEVAEATRFPAPHGGEADFTWPLEIPIDAELRPPVELAADQVRSALAAGLSELAARCGGGQVIVTAYVEPSGEVQSVGAASPDIASPTQLDCVSEAVRALRFPSPGSYLGKVSFTIP